MPAGARDDLAQTRERFNEVFKKYTDLEKKKKVKKKRNETQETIALENIKKNLNLEKDTEEDETILQNTYDPEQGSPRYTKNKRRERETTEKININNSWNQEEQKAPKGKRKSRRELPSLPLPEGTADCVQPEVQDASKPEVSLEHLHEGRVKELKQKSKRAKSKAALESQVQSLVEDVEDKLLLEYQQRITQEEDKALKKPKATTGEESFVSQRSTLNNDIGKKKKKKLKSVVAEPEERDPDEDAVQDGGADTEIETKGKKKTKKKKHIEAEKADVEAEAALKPQFDDSLVLGVYVHRTDRLKDQLLISHPMVKIHVVDEVTGQYVKKEDSNRHVSSFYEQENIDHIIPIMTQPFDFRKNKSVLPEWQEQIIFNERFGYFVGQNEESPRVLLFFEILDFMTMEEARAKIEADKHERGFRTIAWAFLKLVSTNDTLNVGSKLRLQLFCPPPRAKRQPRGIEVVEWWRKHPRVKYASTLYVTVKGIKPPEHVDPGIRSMMALQEERGSTSYSELQKETARKDPSQVMDSQAPVLAWTRLPGQVCRIPNKAALSFRGGQAGCFTLLFSCAGTMLAAACADRDAFPVVVYEIPSGRVLAAFSGHLKIVYDLCWSGDDHRLLSASSDGTVREWDVERLQGTARKVLPHPSFVYCAQYHPAAQNLVVTGGFDTLLRVWRVDVDDVNGQLLQEFDGHGGLVNTLCYDPEGDKMFSADNAGVIIVWKTTVQHDNRPQEYQSWCVQKRIEERDLSGVPINMLQLHPNGRCLLIHAQDSVLRMMDLRILVVKKYTGATNYRERIYSTFTPCGNFIFSGSEDGMAYVWNTDTGDQVAVYSELCYPTALHGVAFHPHENMVAFCAFGQSQPVHVYLYDRKVSQLEMHNARSISAASRSAASVDEKSCGTTPNPDRPSASTLDHFAQTTRLAIKMQSVQEHLDSVLDSHRRSAASGFLFESDKTELAHTERSLTSESSRLGLNPSLHLPPLLSPHSKQQLSGSLVEQLIPQAALSSHNRSFRSVGQRQKGGSSLKLQPSVSDNLPVGPEGDTSCSSQEFVVALYDYTAARLDELTLRRGDVIHVLFKDNDNWWLGRLPDGKKGYFLASYVADHKNVNEEGLQSLEGHAASSDGTVDRSTPTRVSAMISSSGELRFLSEPTLSDTEPELTQNKLRKKKKVKKAGVLTQSACQATFSDADAGESANSGTVNRATRRPLPKRPMGRTNDAYVSDA